MHAKKRIMTKFDQLFTDESKLIQFGYAKDPAKVTTHSDGANKEVFFQATYGPDAYQFENVQITITTKKIPSADIPNREAYLDAAAIAADQNNTITDILSRKLDGEDALSYTSTPNNQPKEGIPYTNQVTRSTHKDMAIEIVFSVPIDAKSETSTNVMAEQILFYESFAFLQ
jgi:hypothetical protein